VLVLRGVEIGRLSRCFELFFCCFDFRSEGGDDGLQLGVLSVTGGDFGLQPVDFFEVVAPAVLLSAGGGVSAVGWLICLDDLRKAVWSMLEAYRLTESLEGFGDGRWQRR